MHAFPSIVGPIAARRGRLYPWTVGGGDGLTVGADGRVRCAWGAGSPDYTEYHDREWGRPTDDDRWLFEKICLEGFQSGLSWLTILRKREAYRLAFDDFEPARVARYDRRRIERSLGNAGIVRNRLKVESAVKNARAFLKVQEEFGSFDQYQWQFVAGKPIQNRHTSIQEVPARTPLSDALSKDLKKRGFSFVGSTIVYAYLQAVGMVNDHLVTCFRYSATRNAAGARQRGGTPFPTPHPL
jgi:DNA-3-methyladenine glycosylase I